MSGETVDPIETEASENEIQEAVNGWFSYISEKFTVHPHLISGITHDVLPEINTPDSRTVNFSLVDTMAPELSQLGALARSVQNHVYVEGIRSPNTEVAFTELYAADEDRERGPFGADAQDRLPQSLSEQGITPNRFLLNVTSSNQFDSYFAGKPLEYRVQNTVFFIDENGLYQSIILRSGPGWGVIDEAGGTDHIKPATSKDMKLVQNAFRHATINIGK